MVAHESLTLTAKDHNLHPQPNRKPTNMYHFGAVRMWVGKPVYKSGGLDWQIKGTKFVVNMNVPFVKLL